MCELNLSQNAFLGKVFWDTKVGHEILKITVTFAGCPTFPKLTWESGKGKNPYAMRVTGWAVPLSQNSSGTWDCAAPYPVPLSHPPTLVGGGTGGKEGELSTAARARQYVFSHALALDQPVVIATLDRADLMAMLESNGFTLVEAQDAVQAMILEGGLRPLHCDKVQVIA